LQGVLAQAKNGDQVFWEEKFHAANGKAQACTQGGEFFHISQLPNVFALCSIQVPNEFPICSPVSQCSPHHLTFIPYALENGVILSLI